MLRVLGIASLVLASPAAAAAAEPAIPEAHIPRLVAEATTPQGFAPEGWALEVQAAGDLDGDGDADVVGVVRGQDPSLLLENDGLGSAQLDTNPRILFVAFRQPDGSYRLGQQDAALIPRHVLPTMEDAFGEGDGLEVKGRSIRVRLRALMNAGGWDSFTVVYTLRWQNGRLEMIGYDRMDINRGSGAVSEVSINYSTGRVKIAKGSIEDDELAVRWDTLRDRRRMPLADIGDGLDFDSGFGAE